MNLLVTGGTGFIGGWLIDGALEQGHVITIVTPPGRGERLRRRSVGGTQLRVLEHRAEGAAGELSGEGFDALVNLVGPGKDEWMANWQANVEYVGQLNGLLRGIRVGCVIHFSSVAVYGITRRSRNGAIREDDELAPSDWYGTTKALGERLWRKFHDETGVPVTVLRPSWVIGRGSHLLDHYLVKAARSGVLLHMLPRAPLNAIPVRDVVGVALKAASAGRKGFRVYNVNPTGTHHFAELLDAVRQEVPGRKIRVPIPGMAVKALSRRFSSLRFLLSGLRIDAARAGDELGLNPQLDLRSAVRDMSDG